MIRLDWGKEHFKNGETAMKVKGRAMRLNGANVALATNQEHHFGVVVFSDLTQEQAQQVYEFFCQTKHIKSSKPTTEDGIFYRVEVPIPLVKKSPETQEGRCLATEQQSPVA